MFLAAYFFNDTKTSGIAISHVETLSKKKGSGSCFNKDKDNVLAWFTSPNLIIL